MNHLLLAKEFVVMTKCRGVPTIWFWRDEWFQWTGRSYGPRSRPEMERMILDWLTANGRPSRLSDVRTILSMLRLSQEIPTHQATKTTGCLTVRNGILRLDDRLRLLRHSPKAFEFTSTEYDFVPNAGCPTWNGFLHQLWPNDSASVSLLQEWFGYCLLPDTSHQKILTLIGPPRSGKGTIGRILRSLIGSKAVASPSIRSLSGQFGLWGLLNKSLAIIPDATLPSSCPALEEILKSISGEDSIDIHRKGLPPVTSVRLHTRLMILANEIPQFQDRSGALASRLLLLKTRTSFAGLEDRQLCERLLIELPGILNWSIEGLRRLRRQGRFTQLAVPLAARKSRGRKVREIVMELVETLGITNRASRRNRQVRSL